MTSTKPDICYSVGLVSRYQSNPSKEHWQAVERRLRYIQRSKKMKLCFGQRDLVLYGYLDEDFVKKIMMIANPLVKVYFFLEVVLSHGQVKSKLVLLGIQWKQNMLHVVLQPLNPFGLSAFLNI